MSTFRQEPNFPIDLSGIPTQLGGRVKWLVTIVVVVVAFFLLAFLRGIYTDWLWFGAIDFRSVYVTVLITRVVLFVIGAIVFGIAVGASLYVTNRVSRGPEEIPLPPATRDLIKKLVYWGTIVGAIVLSVIFGVLAAGDWEIFLRFTNSALFNVDDPVFGKDISFYVFTMPLYEFLQEWLFTAVIAIALASAGLYFINFSLRGVGLLITPGLRVHGSIMAAILMLALALNHWLDRWGLLLSDQGAVYGAAYADVNARMPAQLILTIIAIAAAVLILVNAYQRGIRLLIAGVALWGVAAILLGIVWPNAVQRLTVRPNEFAREGTYITRNIDLTRLGFGLDTISEQPYPADSVLSLGIVDDNSQTVDNIRLWDHAPISNVYKQIQLIRPYYDFNDADVDRYTVDGEFRQVMLAAREVAQEKLNPDAQTWVNTRLRFTHGFGVAMSPVTEFGSDGRPEFFAKDIPPDGVIQIKTDGQTTQPETVIENPRIYYGERTDDYVVVNTNTDELDYQAEGSELRSTKYFGSGGVPISSFVNRAAYAWEFLDVNLLITGEITDESKIQYRRQVQERISTIAPFLDLDHDPYIVAAEGGLFWVQDAYTTSDRFPYSDPADGGFNYIRNSVKITVDAFNGTVKFYVWEPTDPVIQAYQGMFPKLFTSKDEMPQSIQTHVRYPRDLFEAQAEKYLRYHMLDPQDFYNLEDIWSIPTEKFGQAATDLQPVEPYYAIMKIPEEDREEFVLLLPYTRNEPPIMAGWLAARNDGEHYGKLLAFDFPKDRQVDGPEQIEAKIDNDPTISEWFTLRCQEGSFCIRGNLLVLPMESDGQFSILYAEPVYLQAEGVEFPELKQVILATQQDVVMEASVSEALAALLGASDRPGPVDGEPSTGEPGLPAETVQEGINALRDALRALQEGISGIERAIQELSDIAGEQ